MSLFSDLSNADFRGLCPVLEGLSDADIERLRAHLEECRFEIGDLLMQSGSCGRQVLLIARGRLRVVSDGDETQGVVLSFCARGELLGEINALTAGGHCADVIAEEEVFA